MCDNSVVYQSYQENFYFILSNDYTCKLIVVRLIDHGFTCAINNKFTRGRYGSWSIYQPSLPSLGRVSTSVSRCAMHPRRMQKTKLAPHRDLKTSYGVVGRISSRVYVLRVKPQKVEIHHMGEYLQHPHRPLTNKYESQPCACLTHCLCFLSSQLKVIIFLLRLCHASSLDRGCVWFVHRLRSSALVRVSPITLPLL